MYSRRRKGRRVQSLRTEVQQRDATTALTWTAPQPGTYLIESGTHPSIQGPMGLYGILVVTTAPGRHDRRHEPRRAAPYPALPAAPAVLRC